MNNVVLCSSLSPGDILIMTHAVRELARTGQYCLDVKTPFPDLWLNNPHLSQLQEPIYRLQISYSEAIQKCNQRDKHFAWGYLEDVNRRLNADARLSDLRPDLHLSDLEPQASKYCIDRPYWVIVNGGKRDFLTKIWDPCYAQRVVDMTVGDIAWVQIGRSADIHYPLRNVIDLTDKTTLREALWLIRRSRGVLCPVTWTMHAAAALNRPCVVVAGGREPWWWEAYTAETWRRNIGSDPPDDFVPHQYLHTIGRMDCCKFGGCWRPKLHDPDPQRNCVLQVLGPARSQPQCLAQQTPERVVAAMQSYGSIRTRPVLKDPVNLDVPVLICVTLYGSDETQRFWSHREQARISFHELHRRVILSIIHNTPPHLYRLRIGLNEVGQDTLDWLNNLSRTRPNIQLYREPVNVGLYPIIRRMLADDSRCTHVIAQMSEQGLRQKLERELDAMERDPGRVPWVSRLWNQIPIGPMPRWTIFLDDDAVVKDPRWLYALDGPARTADYIGYRYVAPQTDDQIKCASNMPWYRGRPLPHYRNRPVVPFCTGAFIMIRSELLRDINWPTERLWHRTGDIELGHALYQRGISIYDLNSAGYQPVEIEDVERRGCPYPEVGMAPADVGAGARRADTPGIRSAHAGIRTYAAAGA